NKKVQILQQYTAYPGEFLIVSFRDGSQKHLPGPAKEWLDPRTHTTIEKEEALQIAAKEAVVVYTEEETEHGATVQRRIIRGPASFVPRPGEWLHTFRWHGTKGNGYKKVPGALVFQKMWLMPDQMYHDVEDVRTADDVLLTIKLMVFFELADVEKMLDETHDPIGDFINAASSDVIDLVGRYPFDQFKQNMEKLNNLETYTQLSGRAEQVGYKLRKIVYRGYSTTQALQQMHEQAIEARTQLKLQRETENQSQDLADFKQKREFERASHQYTQNQAQNEHTLELEKVKQQHELEQEKQKHTQRLELQQQKWEQHQQRKQREQQELLTLEQKRHEQHVTYLQNLREMGVSLTDYLTQGRADQVIELRGHDERELSPHVHLGAHTKESS
ncbi:MAG: hypothetical protein AAGJ35_10230, partial [Myxococcota bacterium]